MYYVGCLTKKKKLFQKPYYIKGNHIYITDTKSAKKKFLKCGIKNIVFAEEMKNDKVFGKLLKPMFCYDENFLAGYLEEMVEHIIRFFNLKMPVDEIAVFSPLYINAGCKFAKIVTVVGEGEDTVIDGVVIRYTKKLKTLPDIGIINSENRLLSLWQVPCINLGEKCGSDHLTATWSTMSFKCNLFPFEISAASLIYLLKNNIDIEYDIVSFRKKSPVLCTFG